MDLRKKLKGLGEEDKIFKPLINEPNAFRIISSEI